MKPQLTRLADRLQKRLATLEAQAVREVAKQYADMRLSDLIALTGAALENGNPTKRIAELERLMGAFRAASAKLNVPPDEMAQLLKTSIEAGLGAGKEMLEVQRADPEIMEAFRLAASDELEYTRHANTRLTRYWGIEQQRFANEVQSVLLEGLERGMNPQQLAGRLRERAKVSKSRASLIVRNELGNAAAYAKSESHKAAGIKEFIWYSAKDVRVRPKHRQRHGKTYSYDNPPEGELPGQPIQCRCVALAVVDEYRVPDKATAPFPEGIGPPVYGKAGKALSKERKREEAQQRRDEWEELKKSKLMRLSNKSIDGPIEVKKDELLELVAEAPFATREVKVPMKYRDILVEGEPIGARASSLKAHLAKRIEAKQWASDTSLETYQNDLRKAATHPDAKVALYDTKGQRTILVFAPNDLPKSHMGESSKEYIAVVVNIDYGTIISGYQVEGLHKLKIPEEAKWLT